MLDMDDLLNQQLEKQGLVPLFPFARGEALEKLTRIAYYDKLRLLYQSICWQLEHARKDIDNMPAPRNPRQSILQNHDRKTFMVWQRQKERLEERLKLMEEQIRKDMNESDK